MIDDPYKVLGVSSNASDDEIKAAYRRLVKKYHPDLNPGNSAAAEKMKELNAAYDQIKNPQKYANQTENRQNQGYHNYQEYQRYQSTENSYDDPFDFGGYRWQSYGYGYGDGGQTASEFSAAEHFIRANDFRSALHVLSEVTESQRNGRWYYLNALANNGEGNNIIALEHIRQAIRLEPHNIEYQRALNVMQNGGRIYQQAGSGFPGGYMKPSLVCLGCCLSQLLCHFCR
jgi:molecular chaperone DnaJ